MDVYELPVSKSGGPRVDVDALEAELNAARENWEASESVNEQLLGRARAAEARLAAQQGAQRDALELRELPFVGEPLCIVCQQYNLVKHIMAQIDAQPDSGGEIYDDALSAIYNVADTSMVTLCHEHQDAALAAPTGGETEPR